MLQRLFWLLLAGCALTGLGQGTDALKAPDPPPFELAQADSMQPGNIPIVVYSEEDHLARRMAVAFHALRDQSPVVRPQVALDGIHGIFQFRFTGIGAAVYEQESPVRAHGHFPLQYQVTFPAPDVLQISGTTLPFDDVKQSYSFDAHEYLLEFVYADPSMIAVKSDPDASAGSVQKPEASSEDQSSQNSFFVTRANKMKALFIDSMIMAGIGVGVVLLFVIGWVLLQRKKGKPAKHSFGDIMAQKSPISVETEPAAVQQPQVYTDEMRENRIRELMAENGLTYDEAALRFSFQDIRSDDE